MFGAGMNEMKEFQVINMILQENPRRRSVADIARHFGLAEGTVYRWGQDPLAGGSPIPKKYIIGLAEYTGDGRYIEWIAANCGYALVPVAQEPGEESPIGRYMELARLQGQLSEVLLKAASRGIRPMDKPKIAVIIGLMLQELRQFQQSILVETDTKLETAPNGNGRR